MIKYGTVQYSTGTVPLPYCTEPYRTSGLLIIKSRTVPYRKNTVLDHFASSNKNLTNFAGDVFNSVLCCPIIHKDYEIGVRGSSSLIFKTAENI